MCELQRHCSRAFNTASGVMRPMPIVQNLKGLFSYQFELVTSQTQGGSLGM